MRALLKSVLFVLLVGFACQSMFAQAPICPDRPLPGSPVQNPLDLYSQNGVLTVNLTLQNQLFLDGFEHYCYVYMYQGQQIEAPTLRLNPGDQLVLNLTNNIQAPYGRQNPKAHMNMGHMQMASKHGVSSPDDPCNGQMVLPSSTNMHFHGLNIPPVCHQDDVINTIIQSGDPSFQYSFQVPANEPPGLYWYHPHAHGFTSTQVGGGASGALIVEGTSPLTQGLTERVLIARQQFKPVGSSQDPDAGAQLTLNFQPAVYPEGGPAPVINVQAGKQEYWRFLNSTTTDFLTLQILFNAVPQDFEVIAIDGVQLATPVFESTVIVPPAGRVEFITPAVPLGTSAIFMNQGFNTGPVGDNNPLQRLANIVPMQNLQMPQVPAHTTRPPTQPVRFSGLKTQIPTGTRKLYFSEQVVGTNPPLQFFITVDGKKPKVFAMDDPPAIVTNTGAVEDWTIENRSGEVHAFHIHQIHFLVMAINGVPVPNPDLQDTIQIPNWAGTGPYPSVTLRMDFRDPNIAGTFVYHCHILDHEDGGMMEKIQVLPAQ